MPDALPTTNADGSTPVSDVVSTRRLLAGAMAEADPPVTQTDLARRLGERDGKVRSRLYLSHVLNGRYDHEAHIPDYLARCWDAFESLLDDRRRVQAQGGREHEQADPA
ncbi:MAG TPA: hypothetical protein EYQ24_10415 [Bacteroidetes bacterium]|nr:hypothetical protein [Bacteroidota bacterium]